MVQTLDDPEVLAQVRATWDPSFWVSFSVIQYIFAVLYYVSAAHAAGDLYLRMRKGARLNARQPILWMLLFFFLGGVVFGTHWILYGAVPDLYLEQSYRYLAVSSLSGFLGNIGLLLGFLGCQAFTFQLFNLSELSNRFNIEMQQKSSMVEKLKKAIIWYLVLADTALFVYSIYQVTIPFGDQYEWNYHLVAVRSLFVFSVIPVCIANFYYGWKVVSVMQYNVTLLGTTGKTDMSKVNNNKNAVGQNSVAGNVRSVVGGTNVNTNASTKSNHMAGVIRRLRIASFILTFGIYGYLGVFGFVPTFIVNADWRQTFNNYFGRTILRTICLGGGLLVCVNAMIYYCRADTAKRAAEATTKSGITTDKKRILQSGIQSGVQSGIQSVMSQSVSVAGANDYDETLSMADHSKSGPGVVRKPSVAPVLSANNNNNNSPLAPRLVSFRNDADRNV